MNKIIDELRKNANEVKGTMVSNTSFKNGDTKNTAKYKVFRANNNVSTIYGKLLEAIIKIFTGDFSISKTSDEKFIFATQGVCFYVDHVKRAIYSNKDVSSLTVASGAICGAILVDAVTRDNGSYAFSDANVFLKESQDLGACVLSGNTNGNEPCAYKVCSYVDSIDMTLNAYTIAKADDFDFVIDEIITDKIGIQDAGYFESFKKVPPKPLEFLEEDEKSLISKYVHMIPVLEGPVIESPTVNEYLDLLSSCRDYLIGLNNVLMYGGTSAGKTFQSIYMAYRLGVPKFTFSCSKNTDETEFTGVFGLQDGNMVLMNLEFAKALQMPCVIELQEAAAMDPGVTQKLHSIMDKRDNTFRLADGSIITRHPKCIIVATINPTYEGCRELNRAFLRRFNAKIELESMTHAQIKTILSAVCRKGISDELMDTIVNVFFKTENYIQTSLKGRYDMALAEFQDWVIFVDHGIDPIKAAMQTFVPGLAELNGKIMTQIKQGILVPAFAK